MCVCVCVCVCQLEIVFFDSTIYIYIYIFHQRKRFRADKEKKQKVPAKTITDADYVDDIAILANTPVQVETLLHTLEQAATSIGLRVNAHKTEYMCFNQTGDKSKLNGSSLKLFDKFTYLGSSVSSTEIDIDTWLTKAWTATNRLSVIWKSDLTDKMKQFLPISDRVDHIYKPLRSGRIWHKVNF